MAEHVYTHAAKQFRPPPPEKLLPAKLPNQPEQRCIACRNDHSTLVQQCERIAYPPAPIRFLRGPSKFCAVTFVELCLRCGEGSPNQNIEDVVPSFASDWQPRLVQSPSFEVSRSGNGGIRVDHPQQTPPCIAHLSVCETRIERDKRGPDRVPQFLRSRCNGGERRMPGVKIRVPAGIIRTHPYCGSAASESAPSSA